jgi:CheY-like chemotaxis protein/anti-sigma regulatory factor (Ser/Thr protein kinase)
MLDDLLDIARVMSGKVRLLREPMDFCAAVKATLNAVHAAGRDREHRVQLDTCEPALVQGDPTRLEQVVWNLVINAITYSAPATLVQVSVHKRPGEVELTVRDEGIGVSAADLDKVFELFYQADNALHRRGGLGLGLTLVKRIVELHGGSISVESAGEGKGSTFIVRLPQAVDGDPSMEAAQIAGALSAIPDASKSEELRILVVDDDDDGRESLRLLLQAVGHAVHTAGNGEAALALAAANTFDMAFIDIGMPGMDGYQLATALRDAGVARMFLVAHTGYGQEEDFAKSKAAGFDMHMVKPVDMDRLQAVFAIVLRGRRK